MLSKWQSWDFLPQINSDLVAPINGISVICATDPFVEKMILEKIKKKLGSRDWWVGFGGDVNGDWILHNFINLDLFSPPRPSIIINAELLPDKFFDFNNQVNWQENFLLLMFSKENSRFGLLAKNLNAHLLLRPRFWETQKLLDLLCSQMRVPINDEVKQYLIDVVENSSETWVPILNQLRSYSQGATVSLTLVQEIISPNKLDQFALAAEFNQKNFSSFFQKLLAVDFDFEIFRGFFYFMENHLLKLLDLSYLHGKTKLSQYDLAIKQSAPLWQGAELGSWCRRFADWEIDCKKQDPFFLTQLMQTALQLENNAFFPDSY